MFDYTDRVCRGDLQRVWWDSTAEDIALFIMTELLVFLETKLL